VEPRRPCERQTGRRAVADNVLVTVDCKPRTDGWGLEATAVDMAGPLVRIDGRCRTSMRDVWAIGDPVGETMLAHKASAQGEMVAETISGVRRQFDPVAIPAVCFTDPEFVSVDLNPADASELGTELIVAQFPFAANGRTLTMEVEEDGWFVCVVARRDNRRVLGVQAVGAHVSQLVGEFTLAIEMGTLLEDVAGTQRAARISTIPRHHDLFESAKQMLYHATKIVSISNYTAGPSRADAQETQDVDFSRRVECLCQILFIGKSRCPLALAEPIRKERRTRRRQPPPRSRLPCKPESPPRPRQ